jgi:4-oxalomesaconate tautomerase
MDQIPIPCSVVRGGTSKGLYFLAHDLPTDRKQRDKLLMAAMGSPDPRQIDGMGGAHPLTSKVAVVSRSSRTDTDVEYLFLQVSPDRADVSDGQNCGNLLAGVGPFAIEQELVSVHDGTTAVRVWMQNTQSRAVVNVQTPQRKVRYDGPAQIDGVPGTHAPILIEFLDTAGSTCGALLPTGRPVDVVEGVPVTCIDNGMPVVCIAASAFGATGSEPPAQLEADKPLTAKVENIRLSAAYLMNLGDVTHMTIPKMCLVSEPTQGGALNTRTFIPHRVHTAIGVLGAVSVATACVIDGSVAANVATIHGIATGPQELQIEHPTGHFNVTVNVARDHRGLPVIRASLLSTARLLMRGEILVPDLTGVTTP